MSYMKSSDSWLVPGGQKSGQNMLPNSLKEGSSHRPACAGKREVKGREAK
jgi:hypothetical protein